MHLRRIFIGVLLALSISACVVHYGPNPLTDHLSLTLNEMAGPDASRAAIYNNEAIANKVANSIRANYVTPVNDQDLVKAIDEWRASLPPEKQTHDPSELTLGMIGAMTKALDPYTTYQTETEALLDEDDRDGKFSGIGVTVRLHDLGLEVVSPTPDSPGAKAGIRSKDVITKVDDEVIAGQAMLEIVRKIRGPVNTSVHLTLQRNTTTIERTIVRQSIDIAHVRGRLKGRIIILQIPRFHSETARQTKETLKDLIAKSDNRATGIILDLRNNPGGLLSSALDVSDIFLSTGRIVSIENPRAKRISHKRASSYDDVATDLPMVVLMNTGSASASEIVSAALSENKRATLIGGKTFGKGVVQSVIEFPEGDVLRLTTERYLTPYGRDINGIGIPPDVPVKQDEETEADEVLETGLKVVMGMK